MLTNESCVHAAYMICNMDDLSGRLFVLDGHHVGEVSLVDFHVHIESSTESSNLHVVTISTALSHLLQMTLENTVDFLCCGRGSMKRCGESPSVLSLGITTSATARVYLNELFVEICMLTHVFDCCLADFTMAGLVAIELIGEGIEKAVT